MRSRRAFLGLAAFMALFLTLASGFYVMSNLLSALLAVFALSWLWTKLSMRGVTAGAEGSSGAGAGGRKS